MRQTLACCCAKEACAPNAATSAASARIASRLFMERGVSTVTAMCSLRVRSISRCRNQATEPLDLDVESELDVAGSLTPSNAPILTGHFAQQHRHVIARYAERLQIAG